MDVKVTFDYEPGEPDDENDSGLSEEEYDRLTEALIELGAMNVRIVRRIARRPRS